MTFEYTSNPTAHKPYSLLFVGGLGDGLATTSYMTDLVRALEPTKWSLFTLNLTSSYQSWGLGHLDRDTNEIARCLEYIKDYKSEKFGDGKVVFMGHSTGSQCVLHYLYRPNPFVTTPAFDPDLEHVERLKLDGAIMQAPVSDREAIHYVLKEGFGDRSPADVQAMFKKAEAIAKEAVRTDRDFDTVLPLSVTAQICYAANTPITCRRFLSLVSPESPQSPREDDLFSSDLGEEQLVKTFGKIGQQGMLKNQLLVLFSGADQAVSGWIDKEALLSRWRDATDRNGKDQIWDREHSGIVPNASHALSNDDQAEPRKDLVRRVMGYLDNVERA